MAEIDLRYVDREGNRVSWLSTAHAFWNGWLYPEELKVLRQTETEETAEECVKEMQRRIGQRIEQWRTYQ